jgi:hypothetical protein
MGGECPCFRAVCHCWKFARVVDLFLHACSTFTLEDVACLLGTIRYKKLYLQSQNIPQSPSLSTSLLYTLDEICNLFNVLICRCIWKKKYSFLFYSFVLHMSIYSGRGQFVLSDFCIIDILRHIIKGDLKCSC